MKILEGDFSVLQVEVVDKIPQPSSHPEGRRFWKEIDEEAETFQQQVQQIIEQWISFPNLKLFLVTESLGNEVIE